MSPQSSTAQQSRPARLATATATVTARTQTQHSPVVFLSTLMSYFNALLLRDWPSNYKFYNLALFVSEQVPPQTQRKLFLFFLTNSRVIVRLTF
jgi:hypothetical protein